MVKIGRVHPFQGRNVKLNFKNPENAIWNDALFAFIPQVQTELRRCLRKCRNQNHPTPAKRSITQITSRAREGFGQPSSANISSVWHLEAMTERRLAVREGSWSEPRTPTGRQQQLRWTQSEKTDFQAGPRLKDERTTGERRPGRTDTQLSVLRPH